MPTVGGIRHPMTPTLQQQQQQQQQTFQHPTPMQQHLAPPGIASRQAYVAPSSWSATSGSGGQTIGGGAMSWCLPSGVPSEYADAHAVTMQEPEMRKERTKLPDWDVGSSSDPVTVLNAFESWVMRCGVSMSTWCRQPTLGSRLWQCTLEKATHSWMVWSLQTPYERKLEALARPVSGFSPVPFESQSSLEACLRAELLERLPRVVADRVISDNKTQCCEILECAMRLTLPSYHTVRVTLLDAVEAPGTKCSSFPQLLSSLRVWTKTIKLCMTRYNINPEPRRLWLGMLGRIGTLKNEPLFASALDRHMTETGIKSWQTLDNVLNFLVAVETEVESIVLDQSGLSGQQNNNARNQKPQANTATPSPQPTPQANAATGSKGRGGAPASPDKTAGKDKNKQAVEVCKHWNTKSGCRFGASCRNKHPYARVADNICFICGAQEHRSKECPRKDTKKSPQADSASKKSEPRSGSNSRGSSGQSGQKNSGKNQGNDSKDRSSSASNRDKSASNQSGKTGSKGTPSSPQARALSAAVDCSMSEDGLLDSGASH
eukprot:6472415-Amphidinium_carterae.1